jgi:hypothetical protein
MHGTISVDPIVYRLLNDCIPLARADITLESRRSCVRTELGIIDRPLILRVSILEFSIKIYVKKEPHTHVPITLPLLPLGCCTPSCFSFCALRTVLQGTRLGTLCVLLFW